VARQHDCSMDATEKVKSRTSEAPTRQGLSATLPDTSATEKVKTGTSDEPIRQGLSAAPKLARTTFQTSLQMDFLSQKQLVTQTGHEVPDWPLVFVKECIDNSLDAAEEAEIAPVIAVTADAGGITVADNGPGLPESTLRSALDFTVRVSNREAYVAPDRGAQGNALKTLIPMPPVLDPAGGRLIVEADGQRHTITCRMDAVAQRPVIDVASLHVPTAGTQLRIEWTLGADSDGDVIWPFDRMFPLREAFTHRFCSLVEGFALFNPHATFVLDWFGQETRWEATNPQWEKWTPSRPTSPHWYEEQHLSRLIGAYITHDREHHTDRLVAKFVEEFDGMSGSGKRKKVLQDTGLHRVPLSNLAPDGAFDSPRIQTLLAALQRHTRPVPPKSLGVIGADHLRTRLQAMGVRPESFRYSAKLGPPKSKNSRVSAPDKASLIPWVVESAFGYLGPDSADRRRIFAGANWSAAIKNPFRSFGQTGEGLEAALSDSFVGANEPVVFVLHLAQPRIQYTDRGKSAIVIGGVA
jgi:hypothetical protein